MNLSFRTKLFVGQLLLVGVVVAIVAYQLNDALARDLRQQVALRLEHQAAGGAKWMSQNRHPERLAPRVADLVGADVTIYDMDGAVVATSDGAPADPGPVAEVREAIEQGMGHATREHDSGVSVAHVAVRSSDNILRLSTPLRDVDATVAKMQRRLWFASLIGVLAAAVLGFAGSFLAARPLRKMTAAARRITQGEYDVVLPSATPDDFGRLSEALGVLASRLQKDMTQIERLERVRRDFVANISHELRTPVTAIKGYSETLLDGVPDEASRRDFLEGLTRHADRIDALVRDLLKLAKLEVQSEEDRVVDPVDVGSIAGHVATAARTRKRNSDVEIEVDIGEALVARGDPLAVEQVLDNLVDNAVKYAGPGKRVCIEGRRDGEHVEVSVTDDGPGIPVEHRSRVFERFYRVPGAETAKQEGTGLGLAITKHLVEAMHGTIRLEDAPDEGTRFVVRLPAKM